MPRMVVAGGGCYSSSDVVQFIILFFTIFLLREQCPLIEGTHISKQGNLRMDATLESINKDVVMSIQTKIGDIYDCVDIYKQPVFDHPSLKNHKIQMMPTTYLKGRKTNRARNNKIMSFELDGGGCPKGTVPIRKFQMQGLLGNGSISHFGRKVVSKDTNTAVAVARAPTSEYYGTQVRMNIWNPKLGNITDITTSQVWIGGRGYDANIIEVGWMVNPTLYMDWKTRFFVHWTIDAYRSTGCYNILCPGFVQVNERIPIDAPLEPISVYKGVQYDVKIDVFKDPGTGNWFVLKDDIPIGYWPNSLFNLLNTNASNIDWGGEVNTCPTCTFPEMGSGHYPKAGYGKAAYMMDLKVTEEPSIVLKDVTNCALLIDRSECYYIKQNPVGRGDLIGNHIVFGGPGGTC